MSLKNGFARAINEATFGESEASIMTECENYGITFGCDSDCPTLIRGKCELQFSDNKDLMRIVLSALVEDIGIEEVIDYYGTDFIKEAERHELLTSSNTEV